MANIDEIFEQSICALRAQYEEAGKGDEFALWCKMRYVSSNDDDGKAVVTVAAASAFMWRLMTDRGYITQLTDKISSLAGRPAVLSPQFTGESVSSSDEESTSSNAAPVAANTKSAAPAAATVPRSRYAPDLLPAYTFDAFVVGDNNEYAYKVCLAASQNPGVKFNPILLYGGVGLGKTHLMQAIGNYIYREKGDAVRIVCTSAESFANDFSSSIITRTTDKFKAKYRNCDVLLLDDIHFLQGKGKFQDELFYTYNALRDKNKQLVFTCDRPISQLQQMVDRLASRLSNGQCVDLCPPSYDTRRAIIEKKLLLSHRKMSADVIDFIAHTVETNVRDIESAINKITGYAEMTLKPITTELAQYLLRDMKVPTSAITIERIQQVVAEEWGVTVAELRGKTRTARVAYPRQVACYLARELTECAFSDIGREFGGRDHTTIIHAHETIENDRRINENTDVRITALIDRLKGGK